MQPLRLRSTLRAMRRTAIAAPAKDRPSYPGLPASFATPAVRAALDRVLFRGLAPAARDQLAGAREHAEKSQALARSLGNQPDAAIALRILAQLDARAGDYESARRRIEEAFVQAAIHDEYEAIRTRAARARILALAGESSAESELADVELELRRLGTKRELAVLRDLREVR